MHKKLLLVALLMISFFDLLAQCPMCGESARTSLSQGNTSALGLNTGILMLLAGPYLIVIAGGYIWYRNRKKARALEAQNIKQSSIDFQE